MEDQFFIYEDYEVVDFADTLVKFTTVKLKCDIGEFKAGERFAYATIDFANGDLVLAKDEDETYTFKLKLCLA